MPFEGPFVEDTNRPPAVARTSKLGPVNGDVVANHCRPARQDVTWL